MLVDESQQQVAASDVVTEFSRFFLSLGNDLACFVRESLESLLPGVYVQPDLEANPVTDSDRISVLWVEGDSLIDVGECLLVLTHCVVGVSAGVKGSAILAIKFDSRVEGTEGFLVPAEMVQDTAPLPLGLGIVRL
jgi:hypothetical protein